MYGRYTLSIPPEEPETRLNATPTCPLSARYNYAPGQEPPVVTNDASEESRFLKWGLVPLWADSVDIDNNRISTRAEIVREKRSFVGAYGARRCLVLSNGFYEWVDHSGRKQPYRVAFGDDRPFTMADLWERWMTPTKRTGLGDFGSGGPSCEQKLLETFIVVTTKPSDLVSELHHRTAVVLASEDEQTWLHGDPDEAAVLLDTYPNDELVAYPVLTRVSSLVNDGPGLIE